MNFSEAFLAAQRKPHPTKACVIVPGKRIFRDAWPRLQWAIVKEVELSPIKVHDRVCKVRPYLAIVLPNQEVHPWTPTQEDLFAQDWVAV